MDALEELRNLRDLVRQSVERFEGTELDKASATELARRKKLIAEIEQDIRRLEGKLDA